MVTMAAVKHNKIKLREVNRHLVCRLCRGYYVDATTIAECLHSFCRSCIIKYLEKNSFCPICEVQIHKTKPYLNLRLDKALQDVVYKLVPGLYHDEMKRRREFYCKHQDHIPTTTPEQCGVEERLIFSPEDSISLSLEYLESDDYESETVSSQSSESGENPENISFPQQLGLMKVKNEGRTSRRESQDVPESSYPKRYLQCPAVVNISLLKKFLRIKHELTNRMQVDIIHKRVPLPDHYTLMDVAYIFTWKRSAPMRFFYQIYQTRKRKIHLEMPILEKESSQPQLVPPNESKPVKDTVDGKIPNGVAVKSDSEVDKIPEPNTLKPENVVRKSLTEESKPPEKETTPKAEESNQPVKKTEVQPKPDKVENGVKETKKEIPVKDNTPNGVDATKGDTKVESANNKPEKVANVKKVEESSKNRERLLLNPFSGQLESVPSMYQNKPTANGIVVEKKKQSGECGKNDAAKKSEGEIQTDAKKSSVDLLKSFRKEKASAGKEPKVEIKNNNGDSLTITAVTKQEKSQERKLVDVSVEIKTENKGSEYDFDGNSPPSKIMPLQEFTKHLKPYKATQEKDKDKGTKTWTSLQSFRLDMLKENNGKEEPPKKNKRKSVPSLYRLDTEGTKRVGRPPKDKTAGDKVKEKKIPTTLINIQTKEETRSREMKTEVTSPPKPIRIENKGGEYSIKPREEESMKKANGLKPEDKKPEVKVEELNKDKPKTTSPEKLEGSSPKKMKPEEKKNNFGAMDLSKTETSPKSEKNPLENLIDAASKAGTPRNDEKMVEALISAAQKQSIEPLLKIPQFCQNLKNSSLQGSPPTGKNISSNDISQALQFFKDLRSDLKILEAKSQLSPNSFLEQFAQKSPGLEPMQLYQQHIDLIRRFKRQQMAGNDPDSPQRKVPKLSLPPEGKQSPMGDPNQLRGSLERTLTQIQELQELQNRFVAAQNYKNLPALLQFYNRPPMYCAGATSPRSNQHKVKPTSQSSNSPKTPNSQKSPQSLTPPSGSLSLPLPGPEASFLSPQNYSHLINAGLSSEMTFHQMFKNYLNQQDKINKINNTAASLSKKPEAGKFLSEFQYASQSPVPKSEAGSVATPQKT